MVEFWGRTYGPQVTRLRALVGRARSLGRIATPSKYLKVDQVKREVGKAATWGANLGSSPRTRGAQQRVARLVVNDSENYADALR